MGKTTGIEWCDSTLNLQMGCDGCELWNPKTGMKNCYAGTLSELYGGRKGWPRSFEEPALFLERLDEALLKWSDLTGTDRPDKPWLNGMPRLIFLNDMGDTFTESLPLDWLSQPYGPLTCPKGHKPPRVQKLTNGEICCSAADCARVWPARSPLDLIAESPHQFLLLTKRPSRMRRFAEHHPFPKNVWPGTSVTNQATANSRIKELLEITSGGPKWISAEPLLGPVDLTRIATGSWAHGHVDVLSGYLCGEEPDDMRDYDADPRGFVRRKAGEWERGPLGVDLVIGGGESGKGARSTNPECFRLLRDQCQESGVPYFHKQNGDACTDQGKKGGRLLDGRQWNEMPDLARVSA